MDHGQLHRMRWILFWVFVALFCIIVVATLLCIFFGIGSPSHTERSLLFKVFIGEIGAAVITLFYSIFGLKRARETDLPEKERNTHAILKHDKAPEYPKSNILEQAKTSGLVNFIPSRSHYKTSIDRYVDTAQKSIVMVSINLMTGLPFDGLVRVLEERLENRTKPLSVTISLLNPWKVELMTAIAPVLDASPAQLSETAKETLSRLLELKSRLSNEAQTRFEVRVHNAIPFGSAIMIDHREDYGRIQIETKPYKAPFRRSFAFEVIPTESEGLFHTLRSAYEALIADGEPVDFSKLQT